MAEIDTGPLWILGGVAALAAVAWTKRQDVLAALVPHGLTAANRTPFHGDYREPDVVTDWRPAPGWHVTMSGWGSGCGGARRTAGSVGVYRGPLSGGRGGDGAAASTKRRQSRRCPRRPLAGPCCSLSVFSCCQRLCGWLPLSRLSPPPPRGCSRPGSVAVGAPLPHSRAAPIKSSATAILRWAESVRDSGRPPTPGRRTRPG